MYIHVDYKSSFRHCKISAFSAPDKFLVLSGYHYTYLITYILSKNKCQMSITDKKVPKLFDLTIDLIRTI